jgi:predicted NBD/HSP70 family sugar kinase
VVGKSNISLGDVIGIGVGFPGLVDPEKGISMFAPNWGWRDVSIVQVLKQRLSIPVYLDNGAKVQAIAEMLFGAGKGKTNIAVLLMGTGVGSGIIVDGKLFRGTYNNAGEIGHTTINIDGPVCRCGSRGCLEAYIGTNGIIDRHVANSGVAATLQSQEELLEQIVRDALAGDLMSQKTIKETIRYTGCGIANLINAFNPDILLIGGWVGTLLGSSFLPEIIEVVSQFTLPQSFSDLEIKTCQLGLDAVSIGAGALVLEKLLESGGDTAVLTVS